MIRKKSKLLVVIGLLVIMLTGCVGGSKDSSLNNSANTPEDTLEKFIDFQIKELKCTSEKEAKDLIKKYDEFMAPKLTLDGEEVTLEEIKKDTYDNLIWRIDGLEPEAIEKIKRVKIKVTLEDPNWKKNKEEATVEGTLNLEITDPDSNHIEVHEVDIIIVFGKQPNGKWLITEAYEPIS